MKRLNIVIPYRAREAHLNMFVPTVRAYFARDKIDNKIPYRVLVIEQDHAFPFNRGALNNIGYILGRDESDYTCFHDVDYLPIWADYSWPESPCGIVWYGAESRKIAPGRSEAMIHHPNMDFFVGGVFLTPNDLFEQVNGHSNFYFGWGNEDADLRNRFLSKGIAVTRRKGTFEALEHDHQGYEIDGFRTPIAIANQKLFDNLWSTGTNSNFRDDGLSTLAYEIVNRRPIPEGRVVERAATWEMVTVRLLIEPSREQVAAAASPRKAPLLANPAPFQVSSRISRNDPCPCGSGKKYKRCHGAAN